MRPGDIEDDERRSESAFWRRRIVLGGRGRPRPDRSAGAPTRTSARRPATSRSISGLNGDGRGPAQPADLRRRRDAHRRSGPRRDRAGRRQRPPRRRRHAGRSSFRSTTSRAPTTRSRRSTLAEGSVILSVVGIRRQRRSRASTPTTPPSTRTRARACASTPIRAAARPSSCAPARSRCARRAGSYTRARRQLPARPRRRGARDRARQLLARPLRPLGGRPPRGHATTRRAAPRAQYVGEDYAGDVAVARRLRQLGLQLDTTRRYVWRPDVGGGLDALLERLLVLHAGRPDLVVLRPLGLVPLPLRQLVLRRRLEQLVLVARLRLLAGLGLLGLHARLRRLVPDRLVRRFYSPWWNNYYQQLGLDPRGGVAFAINGRFATRRVDFRGWNFTGSDGFGSRAAAWTSSPARASRTGSASRSPISSRPIVVRRARRRGVREPCRASCARRRASIERRPAADSARLAPVLARDRTLPASAVDALRDRAVVADRGRLTGPGAADIAPRGAPRGSRADARLASDRRRRSRARMSGRSSIPSRDRRPRRRERRRGRGVRPRRRTAPADSWRNSPRRSFDSSRPSADSGAGARAAGPRRLARDAGGAAIPLSPATRPRATASRVRSRTGAPARRSRPRAA